MFNRSPSTCVLRSFDTVIASFALLPSLHAETALTIVCIHDSESQKCFRDLRLHFICNHQLSMDSLDYLLKDPAKQPSTNLPHTDLGARRCPNIYLGWTKG